MNFAWPETWSFSLALPFAVPIALYVAVVGLASTRRMHPIIRGLLVTSRMTIAVGLVFLIAGPARRESTTAPGRIDIAVDVSRSMGRTVTTSVLSDLEARLRRHALDVDDVETRVIAFADRRRVVYDGGPMDAAALERIVETLRGIVDEEARDDGEDDAIENDAADGDASVANDALDRLRTVPEAAFLADVDDVAETDRRRWIYTDGAWPAPSLLTSPSSIIGVVPTMFILPSFEDEHDTRVVAVRGETVVAAEQAVELEVVVESSRDFETTLAVRVGDRVVKEVPARLVAGVNTVEIGGRDIVLDPGDHELIVALTEPDATPENDAAGLAVTVREPRYVLCLQGPGPTSGLQAPAVLRALRAQDVSLRVATPDGVARDDAFWRRVSAVVVDRLAPKDIDDDLADRIAGHVESGGGLVLWPDRTRDVLLAWNRHRLGRLLPLGGVPAPPDPPRPDKPKKKDDDEPPPKRLSDPEAKRSRIEKVKAPTLTLLLVIDKSASMRDGGKLANAKKGAIATARELHPEDRIGVIAYNDAPTELVPIQEAKNRETIESAILRLRADGATDVEPALEYARELLADDDAAVKVIVLLSDGYTRPFNIQPVVEGLVADGVTVTTIGIGTKFDRGTLTQIAYFGRGIGPIPAYGARELPKVMVDVTSRMQKKYSTRKAEKKQPRKPPRRPESELKRPRTNLPGEGDKSSSSSRGEEKEPEDSIEKLGLRPVVAREVSYLGGLDWERAPKLYGAHLARSKQGAWLALGLGAPTRPLLAHWAVGEGRVAVWAAPSEGTWARDLATWPANPSLVAQLVRFVASDPRFRPVEIDARRLDDRVAVSVVDHRVRDATRVAGERFVFEDDDGVIDIVDVEAMDESRQLMRLERAPSGSFLRIALADDSAPSSASSPTSSTSSENIVARLAVPVAPPTEILERGLDLERLAPWRAAYDAELRRAGEAIDRPWKRRTTTEIVPAPPAILPWLLLLFLIELVVKRRVGRKT